MHVVFCICGYGMEYARVSMQVGFLYVTMVWNMHDFTFHAGRVLYVTMVWNMHDFTFHAGRVLYVTMV